MITVNIQILVSVQMFANAKMIKGKSAYEICRYTMMSGAPHFFWGTRHMHEQCVPSSFFSFVGPGNEASLLTSATWKSPNNITNLHVHLLDCSCLSFSSLSLGILLGVDVSSRLGDNVRFFPSVTPALEFVGEVASVGGSQLHNNSMMLNILHTVHLTCLFL